MDNFDCILMFRSRGNKYVCREIVYLCLPLSRKCPGNEKQLNSCESQIKITILRFSLFAVRFMWHKQSLIFYLPLL